MPALFSGIPVGPPPGPPSGGKPLFAGVPVQAAPAPPPASADGPDLAQPAPGVDLYQNGNLATPAAQPPAAAPEQPSPGQPSLLGSAVATLGHAASDLPILGPVSQWATDNILAQTVGRASGQDPGEWLKHAQAARDANDQANPIAAEAGGIGGNVAAAMATGGASPVASEALGFGGKLLPSAEGAGRIASSGLSTFGLTAADKMARGEAPAQAAQDAVGPGLLAAGVPAVAEGVGKAIGAGVDAVNDARQASVTNKAIADAPDAATLKKAGNQQFNSSVDTNPPAISGVAYNRLLDGLQASLGKFRPNELNDPQVVGVLQNLTNLGKDANTPGTVIDLKDIHLQRQLANDVAGLPGRQGQMGQIAVDQIDNFIHTLKSPDILGGADPTQATSDLMSGISTWNRATKVSLIQDALQKADTYRNGMDSGLKTSFSNLMRSRDFGRFSPDEQAAIRAVAKGTPLQNVASTFGQLGGNFTGTTHNIVGGGVGSAAATALLSPFVGPLAAVPAGVALSYGGGVAGRAVAENMATKSANRAAQIVATPDIPKVSPLSLPQGAKQVGPIAENVARGTIMAKGAPPQKPLKSPVAKAIYAAGSR